MTQAVIVQGGSLSNVFLNNDFERNGDSTASALDIALLAPGTILIGNKFQSAVLNQPASGIIASTGATSTLLLNNTWVGPYSTAYNFINGATGITGNNTTAAIAFGDPVVALPDSGAAKLGNVRLASAAPTVNSGQVGFGSTHATTIGAAGGATALPATPLGYLIANVDGTQVKIPYYNN